MFGAMNVQAFSVRCWHCGSSWAGRSNRATASNRWPRMPATVTGVARPTRRSGCERSHAYSAAGAGSRLSSNVFDGS